jgi:uncharacterized protein YlxP (DUF503 family)
MIVGASVVELHIHGCRSLKAKRGVVRSITRRVRNRFNLSVAEVGGQDQWQTAVLGLSADVEIVNLPHHEELWDPDDEDGEE